MLLPSYQVSNNNLKLEKLEKMADYGAEDDPHRRVTKNFALYKYFEY
jgi:hypothetical protein